MTFTVVNNTLVILCCCTEKRICYGGVGLGRRGGWVGGGELNVQKPFDIPDSTCKLVFPSSKNGRNKMAMMPVLVSGFT